MDKAVAPGISARDLGIPKAEIARKDGFYKQAGDELFGHGLSNGFPSYVLPIGDTGPYAYKRMSRLLKPGMVLTAEAFQSVRASGRGVESNFIVTDSGAEVLHKTPMRFWYTRYWRVIQVQVGGL